MIGERLQDVRKDHGDTQKDLAAKLNVVFNTVSSWEQNKSEPSHDMLVKICKMYNVSADFLLGLSDIDPVFTRNRQQERLTPEELKELEQVEQYLLWRRKRGKKKA